MVTVQEVVVNYVDTFRKQFSIVIVRDPPPMNAAPEKSPVTEIESPLLLS